MTGGRLYYLTAHLLLHWREVFLVLGMAELKSLLQFSLSEAPGTDFARTKSKSAKCSWSVCDIEFGSDDVLHSIRRIGIGCPLILYSNMLAIAFHFKNTDMIFQGTYSPFPQITRWSRSIQSPKRFRSFRSRDLLKFRPLHIIHLTCCILCVQAGFYANRKEKNRMLQYPGIDDMVANLPTATSHSARKRCSP
jgi:hypothetical protein